MHLSRVIVADALLHCDLARAGAFFRLGRYTPTERFAFRKTVSKALAAFPGYIMEYIFDKLLRKLISWAAAQITSP